MKDFFGKCGFNCGRCAAYKENVKTEEARQRGSDGWKKYFGFQIRLDRMYCDGCQTPDKENPVLLDRSCAIRKCAVINGVETCAHCSEYQACMHDLKIFNPDVNREKIEERMETPMPEEDYIAFIKPYQHLMHLDEIRASLDPEDIAEAKVSTVKPRIADFPDDLPFSREERSAFKALYLLITAVESISGSTQAQREALKKRKEYFLKLLWTFGLFGELKEGKDSHLIIDCEIYFAQKLIGQWNKVALYLNILQGYGVHCELCTVN